MTESQQEVNFIQDRYIMFMVLLSTVSSWNMKHIYYIFTFTYLLLL
jgi:hypothetical protein